MNTTLCQVGADHKKLKELKGWHRTEEPKKGQDQTNGSDDNKQENKKRRKRRGNG